MDGWMLEGTWWGSIGLVQLLECLTQLDQWNLSAFIHFIHVVFLLTELFCKSPWCSRSSELDQKGGRGYMDEGRRDGEIDMWIKEERTKVWIVEYMQEGRRDGWNGGRTGEMKCTVKYRIYTDKLMCDRNHSLLLQPRSDKRREQDTRETVPLPQPLKYGWLGKLSLILSYYWEYKEVYKIICRKWTIPTNLRHQNVQLQHRRQHGHVVFIRPQ